MTTKYVIYKKSRMPGVVSYDGPAWDAAGMRHMRQDQYDDLNVAVAYAQKLSQVNPVGFQVAAVPVQLRPLSEWHEDHGFVLWYRLPITEPPWVGTPNCSDWLVETADGACMTELDANNEKEPIKGPWATHWCPLPDLPENRRA